MSKKLKVMFSVHGLIEGDHAFKTDKLGFPTNEVVEKRVITGQDTGGQVYYVKALASNSNIYDVDLVTRRVDSRICPQFGGKYSDLGPNINYTIEQQWHECENARSRVLRIPAGGNFMFIPKEEIVPLLPEVVDTLYDFYKKNNELSNIEVVEGHYRDGMLAADMLCTKIEKETGIRPVMLVTSHSLGHKKYERNLPQYQEGKISEEEWKWHNFKDRIAHEKYAFDRADIIIATSPDELQRLIAEPYLQDINKITVIPPGYNDKVFKKLSKPERNKFKYQFEYQDLDGHTRCLNLSGKKVVSSLGRVVRDKGFTQLSQSMREIMKNDPSVVYMVSAEKNNPVTQECVQILKGFEDRLILLPSLSQQEMAHIYQTSDVFVMSSLNEAFGMVPIEAMGCNTAVVVGRSGFNDFAHCADVQNDTQDYTKAIGLYAPSQDTSLQVKAIKMLLDNDTLRDQIAENGYRYVSSKLTWENIAKQKDSLVQQVISKKKQNMNLLNKHLKDSTFAK